MKVLQAKFKKGAAFFKKASFVALIFVFFSLSLKNAAAQIDFANLENIAAPSFAGRDIGYVINSAVGYIFPIAGFLLLIFLVFGGYQYLLSGGDPKKTQSAQKNITWAIVGFIIIFLAYWIVIIVGRILDIRAIGNMFG